MATSPLIEFLQRIRGSVLLREGGEQSDAQLLEAFIRQRDSQALEGLVRRHAPMVWGVCRRTLASHHDAEDAFQSTFLVLVRKAASIRSRELLANWLYRAAQTTARKARQMAAKRYARQKAMVPMPEPKTQSRDREFGPELRALLDEELSRLPDKYRIAVLLCDLEDRSRTEAAQQLQLPEGTLASRLARGRALLAQRLTRRGVTISAAALAAALPQQAASVCVPAALLSNTIKAVTLLAAGGATAAGAISAQVSALTREVMAATMLGKKKAVGILLFMAAFVLGGGIVTYHLVPCQPNHPEPPPKERVTGNVKGDAQDYGSEAGATHFAKEAFQRIGQRIGGLELWPARNMEATLDPETHQWTVSGDVRAYSFADVNSWETALSLVVSYNPSSRSYSHETFNLSSIWPLGPEKGWRPARMNELGKWVQGEFIKPMPSTTPISSLRLVSHKADRILQRRSYSYPGSDLTVQKSPRGVIVYVDNHDAAETSVDTWPRRPVKRWTFRFGGPDGRYLEVSKYGGVLESDPYDRVCVPYMGIELNLENQNVNLASAFHSLEFAVWEIEVKDQKVVRLAIDFTSNGTGLCGSLRVNSRFQHEIPVPGPEYRPLPP
jgi:RNA polymerase sigma factor (sigma-70 family)